MSVVTLEHPFFFHPDSRELIGSHPSLFFSEKFETLLEANPSAIRLRRGGLRPDGCVAALVPEW
jgi:hypothetical protein